MFCGKCARYQRAPWSTCYYEYEIQTDQTDRSIWQRPARGQPASSELNGLKGKHMNFCLATIYFWFPRFLWCHDYKIEVPVNRIFVLQLFQGVILDLHDRFTRGGTEGGKENGYCTFRVVQYWRCQLRVSSTGELVLGVQQYSMLTSGTSGKTS